MAVDEPADDFFLASRFRVAWDGRDVPGVVSVSALRWTLEETRTESLAAIADEIRLERTRGADDAFEAWAERARRVAGRGRPEVRERARKDVMVELLASTSEATLAFVLRGCTPRAYLPVAGLDAANPEPAREVLILDCESVERVRV